MTKKETEALLEAVKNAPIVNSSVTVTVLGTTYTFGNEWRRPFTDDTRQQWLDSIAASCRMRLTSSYSKKVLDEPGLRHQNRIVEKMLYKYVIDNKLKTKKESENFYFVIDVDKKYKFVSREDIYKAIEFAKGIGKKRSDVFKVQA